MQSCAHTTSFPLFPLHATFLSSRAVSQFSSSAAFFLLSFHIRCVLRSPGKKDSRDLKRDFSRRTVLGRDAFRNWILSLRNLLMWEIRSGVVRKNSILLFDSILSAFLQRRFNQHYTKNIKNMENKANKLFVQMAKKTQPTSNQDSGKNIMAFQGLEKYIPHPTLRWNLLGRSQSKITQPLIPNLGNFGKKGFDIHATSNFFKDTWWPSFHGRQMRFPFIVKSLDRKRK